MKDIFIKYNPYKVETEVEIDGKKVKANSALNVDDKRLQEWIEDLPKILVDECNTKTFKVTFHGTILDYEDLTSVAKEANERGIEIKCSHIAAKEVGDKEKAIEKIFRDIQKGPFEELKQPDLKKAFEMASSSDFEVNVVATMGAGKSTLINALLRQKLMPTKHEACTATIIKIKDNDLDDFRAEVYDKNGDIIQTHSEVTFNKMEILNENSSVSTIKVEGNIPFVTADDVSLVLVDTPGPNNSRDPEHKAATYRMLSESSKTVVLYILNATQLAVNDDNNLLNYVADSMRVGGKQSKDRFIFVVNKLDEFKKGEDSVVNSIEKVKKYLEDKGIKNPNIYPATALPALNIRTSLNDVDISNLNLMDDDVPENVMESVMKVKKLNRNEELHLEKYAPLTASALGEITSELAIARESKDMCKEALIHTGIVSIESAIRMYVAKYAKTAKIKNVVDTFSKKLESTKTFEKIKQEIAVNQDKHNEILSEIENINIKLESREEAKKFKEKINKINYDKEIEDITKSIIKKGQGEVTRQIEKHAGKKLSQKEAVNIISEFFKFLEQLQAKLEISLENEITKHVEKNAVELLNQYKDKIITLGNDVKVGDIDINPFKMMEGDIGKTITNIGTLIISSIETEQVVVNERKEYKELIGARRCCNNVVRSLFKINYDAFKVDYDIEYDYENVEYIDGSKLSQRFFAEPQRQLFEFGDSSLDYAKEQVEQIKAEFNKKFIELDGILNEKLKELEVCANNSNNVENVIEETKKRLMWLEGIQMRIQSILEI